MPRSELEFTPREPNPHGNDVSGQTLLYERLGVEPTLESVKPASRRQLSELECKLEMRQRTPEILIYHKNFCDIPRGGAPRPETTNEAIELARAVGLAPPLVDEDLAERSDIADQAANACRSARSSSLETYGNP
jgi:hypothetical protein